MSLNVVDLFCGAGGLSMGFRMAGCSVTHAVERDEWAAATYRANNPDTTLIEGDIYSVDPAQIAEPKDSPKLFAVIGGPPCQGFSEANRRTRTAENKQNYLYREFFRFVRSLRPRWFVLENVAGLRTLAEGRFLKSILQSAARARYSASYAECNAADYGVPQFRRRLFVIGCCHRAPFEPPAPTHGDGLTPYVTVRDAIGDLPALPNGASADLLPYRSGIESASAYQRLMRREPSVATVQGNLVTNSNPSVIDRYRGIRQGCNWTSIPTSKFHNYADVSRCHTGLYYRLAWKRPARVIGNFRKNMLIHPSQSRGLSVREAARLQSFPDDFRFCGSIGFQQQQVADAVPPLLAKAIAEALIRAMCPRNGLALSATS
jgi:DNA (cytosine-5)-methyltransferase 1